MFVPGVTEGRVGVGVGGRTGGSRVVPGCTGGKGDGHPPSHNLESSSDPSAQLSTLLHRRSPSIQAP